MSKFDKAWSELQNTMESISFRYELNKKDKKDLIRMLGEDLESEE